MSVEATIVYATGALLVLITAVRFLNARTD